MKLGWFETIQLLGLDVMGMVAMVLLLLAELGDMAKWTVQLVSRRIASRADRAPARVVESKNDAWPPKEWRPSH
jgi:hypothetical protein